MSNIKESSRNAGVGYEIPFNSTLHNYVPWKKNEEKIGKFCWIRENSAYNTQTKTNSRVRDIVRNIEGYCDDEISTKIINISKSFNPLRKSKYRSAMDLTSMNEEQQQQQHVYVNRDFQPYAAKSQERRLFHNNYYENIDRTRVMSTSIACILDNKVKKKKSSRIKFLNDDDENSSMRKKEFSLSDEDDRNNGNGEVAVVVVKNEKKFNKKPVIIIKEVIPATTTDKTFNSRMNINERLHVDVNVDDDDATSSFWNNDKNDINTSSLFDSYITTAGTDEYKLDKRYYNEVSSKMNNNNVNPVTSHVNQEKQFLISTDIIKDDRKKTYDNEMNAKERPNNHRPNRRLLTLDEILLEKSNGERKKFEISGSGIKKNIDMFYMNANERRNKHKEHVEIINAVPETGSTESGYISDNSCMINSQNTTLDAGILCSPSSTVSLTSELSIGSNKSGNSRKQQQQQQARINSNIIPNFAKPTEASIRRSKQSSSPDQSENESISEHIIQKKFIESLRSSEWDLKNPSSISSNPFCTATATATLTAANEQPHMTKGGRKYQKPTQDYLNMEAPDEQGEYFVLKRWRESLRKFSDKIQEKAKKPQRQSKKEPPTFVSSSTRPMLNDDLKNTTVDDENDSSSYTDETTFDRMGRRKDVFFRSFHYGGIKDEKKNDYMNYGGGDGFTFKNKASKACSLESVNQQQNNEKSKERIVSIYPATGNFGSSNFKFYTLDTVSEGKILDASSSLPIRPQLRGSNNLNRYFSEMNLLQQCNALGQECTRSENVICNVHKPLRYKRESWVRRYGTDDSNNLPDEDVELEPDADPPFERRNVVPRKDCTIENEYTIVDFLGRGKFGEVKKCIEKKTKKEFAVKLVPVRSEADRREVLNEIEVMNSLQHPRLLQLYDAFDGKREIALVMELINGGELFERVIDEDFILTERLCELYVEQICEGIAFMHKENFLHLDMKPENILCINRHGHRIKIIDFGLARKFKPGDTLKILFGTPEFVAPEVISYEKIGRGTDMWSIGVICYVLLSGLSPFMGENDVETYNNISRVEYDFDDEAFEEISAEAKDFISKLLILRKEDRMTANECLRHSWLTRHKNVDKNGDEIQINTKKLRRFVIRRRWQKAVNALLALKRMGMTL